MRVIHIVHGKANPASHNGISRVVYNLNKYEKALGISSEIWAIVDGTEKACTHKRDEFVSVECFPRVRWPYGRHTIIERLLAEKDSIDLVHFHLIWFYDKNIIAAALKKNRIPFIITTHGTYSKDHAYTGKRLLAKWLFEVDYLNMASEIHAITREEGTGLQKYGYTGRSFVAYNGIDQDEVPPERDRHFYAKKRYSKRIKLVWVGVLREDKNIRSLLQAIAMLSSADRASVVCILVGPDYNGNAAQYLNTADQLGIAENIDYLGPLYGQKKYDAIESADIYVMPSISEVFSLATLDAMACSKPCLITSGCGYSYFVNHDFFVPCEPYAQDIARGLQQILNRKMDWPDMGDRARKLIESDLSWASIANVMKENYARIIEGSYDVV